MKLNVVEEPSQEKGPYKRRRRFKGVGEIIRGPVIWKWYVVYWEKKDTTGPERGGRQEQARTINQYNKCVEMS